jgi:organic hydroperoxide reductase OsmC/OhrA
MMGTFAAMLAKKRIATPAERYHADVNGDIEDVGGVLKITRIGVHYSLKLPPDKRSEAQECFATYIKGCPAAQSVIGCIDIRHTLEMVDL